MAKKKKYHIGCPNCGKDFAQSGDGTATDTFCPKCNARISYEVIGTQVHVVLLSEPDLPQNTAKPALRA